MGLDQIERRVGGAQGAAVELAARDFGQAARLRERTGCVARLGRSERGLGRLEPVRECR